MAITNDKIERVRELIKKRDEIDAELAELFAGGSVAKKTNKCSLCGQEGHTARICPNKEPLKPQPAPPPNSTAVPTTGFVGGKI